MRQVWLSPNKYNKANIYNSYYKSTLRVTFLVPVNFQNRVSISVDISSVSYQEQR